MAFGWVLLLFVFVVVVLEIILGVALELTGLNQVEAIDSWNTLFITTPLLISTGLATWIAWLPSRERIGLRDPDALKRLGLGAAAGAIALTLAVVLPAVAGVTSLHFDGGWPLYSGFVQLMVLAPAGIAEELLLRGLGFQALRRGVGDLAAVLVSSAIFGAMHLMNPHASWVASLIITLVGVWFGVMVVRTGSVWMGIAAHVTWNFFEGFVFGQPVSGNLARSSLFTASWPVERSFWSGGDFGPEAAGFTVPVLLAAIALTWAWKPRQPVTSTPEPTTATSPASSPSSGPTT
ncbi:MAG: CPBP family intramembrane glutamic endopeptidase [Archangium sp.]